MDNEQIGYRVNEIFRLVTTLVEQGKDHSARLGNIEDKVDDNTKEIFELKKDVSLLRKQFAVTSGHFDDLITRVLEIYN